MEYNFGRIHLRNTKTVWPFKFPINLTVYVASNCILKFKSIRLANWLKWYCKEEIKNIKVNIHVFNESIINGLSCFTSVSKHIGGVVKKTYLVDVQTKMGPDQTAYGRVTWEEFYPVRSLSRQLIHWSRLSLRLNWTFHCQLTKYKFCQRIAR